MSGRDKTLVSYTLRHKYVPQFGLIAIGMFLLGCTSASRISADGTQICSPKYMSVYQPATSVGGSGSTILIPNGENCVPYVNEENTSSVSGRTTESINYEKGFHQFGESALAEVMCIHNTMVDIKARSNPRRHNADETLVFDVINRTEKLGILVPTALNNGLWTVEFVTGSDHTLDRLLISPEYNEFAKAVSLSIDELRRYSIDLPEAVQKAKSAGPVALKISAGMHAPNYDGMARRLYDACPPLFLKLP